MAMHSQSGGSGSANPGHSLSPGVKRRAGNPGTRRSARSTVQRTYETGGVVASAAVAKDAVLLGSPPSLRRLDWSASTDVQAVFKSQLGDCATGLCEEKMKVMLHLYARILSLESGAEIPDWARQYSKDISAESQIPFLSQAYDPLRSFDSVLRDHEEVRTKFEATIAKTKREPWDLSVDLSRPAALKYKDASDDGGAGNVDVAREYIVNLQTTVGDSADTATVRQGSHRVVSDISGESAYAIDFVDVEHLDPWKLIVTRVKAFLTYVNELPSNARYEFAKALSHSQRSFFIVDPNTHSVSPSKYLRLCLFNAPENILFHNHPGNMKKSDTPIVDWLKNHPSYGERFVSEVSSVACDLADIVDDSGFVLRFKSEAPVKAEYWGKGMGYAMDKYGIKVFMGGEMVAHKRELMKNEELVNAVLRLISFLKSMDDKDREGDIRQLQGLLRAHFATLKQGRSIIRQGVRQLFSGDFGTDAAIYESSASPSASQTVTTTTAGIPQELRHQGLRAELEQDQVKVAQLDTHTQDLEAFDAKVAVELRKMQQEELADLKRRNEALAIANRAQEDELRQLRAEIARLRAAAPEVESPPEMPVDSDDARAASSAGGEDVDQDSDGSAEASDGSGSPAHKRTRIDPRLLPQEDQ